MTGWRPLLRLAWRDVARHRGRSAVVLVMLTLPVLVVTAGAVLLATASIDARERLDRELGPQGQALVEVPQAGLGPIEQAPDPWDGWQTVDGSLGASGGAVQGPPSALDAADVTRLLGEDRPVTSVQRGYVRLVEGGGTPLDAAALETDLSSPLGEGLLELREGRLPVEDDEVVVNGQARRAGLDVGDVVTVGRGEDVVDRTVVGIAEDRATAAPWIAGRPGALGDLGSPWRQYLVGGGPVSWEDVEAVNAEGATVLSREVVLDPPAEAAAFAEENGFVSSSTTEDGAVLSIIVVMVLIEVVLLAGPAFAVGARRQSRTIALLAAGGASPGQVRGLVMAGAVVLGTLAAAIGVAGGILVGALGFPVVDAVTRLDALADLAPTSRPGPFDVPWPMVLAVATFGLVSALLAAFVPAWLASRSDVVATLGGRRAEARGSIRSPLVGLVLVVIGVLGVVGGATDRRPTLIAGAAIPMVLGMVLLVAPVLALLARGAARLPLALRFAVRDASRQRSRTVPAVAAVAATVAGAVALGIGGASDQEQERLTYQPQLADGAGALVAWDPAVDVADLAAVVEREAPGVEVVEVSGLTSPDEAVQYVQWDVVTDGDERGSWTSAYGAEVLVADRLDDALLAGLVPADRERAQAALGAGRPVVVATEDGVGGDPGEGTPVEVTALRWDEATGEEETLVDADLEALVVRTGLSAAPYRAVLPTALAADLTADLPELAPRVTGLAVAGGMSVEEEDAVAAALAETVPDSALYVERGYVPSADVVWALVALAGVALVLVLGGSLTATALSMNDAAPDLATLGAIGASPGLRRRVAAAQGLVIAGVGALLGLLVGLVPGIAVTYPLTDESWLVEVAPDYPGHALVLPWGLLAVLVVGLPVVVAGVAALTTRSGTLLTPRRG